MTQKTESKDSNEQFDKTTTEHGGGKKSLYQMQNQGKGLHA